MSDISPKENNFLLYQSSKGAIRLNVLLHNETIWLTQKLMAQLFGCSSDNIDLHLKNIVQTGALDEKLTTEYFSVVQMEGNQRVNRKSKFYE